MSKGLLTISFEETSMLIENKEVKGNDIIRIQPIGTRKEFFLKFDVSVSIFGNSNLHIPLYSDICTL